MVKEKKERILHSADICAYLQKNNFFKCTIVDTEDLFRASGFVLRILGSQGVKSYIIPPTDSYGRMTSGFDCFSKDATGYPWLIELYDNSVGFGLEEDIAKILNNYMNLTDEERKVLAHTYDSEKFAELLRSFNTLGNHQEYSAYKKNINSGKIKKLGILFKSLLKK